MSSSHIIFESYDIATSEVKKLDKTELLSVPGAFKMETCSMKMYDAASVVGDIPNVIFIVKANLSSSKEKAKLQNLKLETGLLNTYFLRLEVVPLYLVDENNLKASYNLTGRSTSEIRALARKNLLATLGGYDYSYTIEVAREKIIKKYTSVILKRLFDPNKELIKQNTVAVNTWLTKLLG